MNYLRLAVTDRCNLRCFYCMPAEGLPWIERRSLMSYEEMLRLCRLGTSMGISKIRITGGEPFVRKDMMSFLTALTQLNGLDELTLTTNGVLTAPLVPELKKIGIRSVNLSLDTLDRDRFFSITRRDELPKVLETLDALLQHDIRVKINAVVMAGKNTQDIIPLVQLTRDLPVDVRFIEEMPFNGSGLPEPELLWDHLRIRNHIRETFPSLKKIPDPPFATAAHYSIDGHLGRVGIIAAYTRSFCGSCNRIRVTPLGDLKTCLYGPAEVNIKELMRQGQDDEALRAALMQALMQKPVDGRAAELTHTGAFESMAAIGG